MQDKHAPISPKVHILLLVSPTKLTMSNSIEYNRYC